MTREEHIEHLQNLVMLERIVSIDDLRYECKSSGYDINEFDDILSPMGWNSCDRCGRLADSEWNMFWLDGFDWNDDDPAEVRMQKKLEEEGNDYVAICYNCVEELKGE